MELLVGDESSRQMRHLRSQARKLGFTIRTHGTRPPSGSRVYSLRDRETGDVVGSDLTDLLEVQARLWWVVRDRRRALSGLPPVAERPKDHCPVCGTPRVAYFRLCTSCGADYEASREPTPDAVRTPLSVPRPLSIPRPLSVPTPLSVPIPLAVTPKSDPVGPTTSDIDPIEPKPSAREPIRERLGWLVYDVRQGYRFGILRRLAAGVLIGLLVGGLVAMLLALPKG